jgi:predicted nucleic-acid-binding protein
MIGVDTNVLMRYLLRDDRQQSQQAKVIMDGFTQQQPGFISITTLLETMWLLRQTYKMSKEDVLQIVHALVVSTSIRIQAEPAVDEAIEIAQRGNFDLPDVLVSIFGRDAGCSHTLTFDRKAATIPGMMLI